MKDISKPKDLIDKKSLQSILDHLLGSSAHKADSAGFRLELINALKSVNTENRLKAEKLLFADGDGTKCAKRLSQLQDNLIWLIHKFAQTLYASAEQQQLCIAAVGGYGRGTLAPGSDIDLLFILPKSAEANHTKLVEFVLYMLWDLGFKVGHATRNVNECIQKAQADMTIRTSILEARFIDGSDLLFNQLTDRFSKEIVAKSAKEFIDAKLLERDLRHSKTGESRYLVEPNIKDGKGGLRDLHTLFWIGKYYYQVERQRDLVKAGLFTADEFKRFKRAEKFLWTVRCHVHFLTNRPEERLSFDIQREMAERLKYISHGGLLNVERFMKHYFLIAKDVGDLTLIVCARLEELQAKSVTGINGLIRSIRFPKRRISGTTDFIDDYGRISITNDKVFEKDPVNLLRLFKLADDNQLDIHPDAKYLVTNSLHLIDRKFRANEEANRLFLSVLTSRNNPESLLRKMNETGLLGQFIPAFGKIVAMMQFNMYHHYTVDEHLIRAVGILSDIENGRISEEHPLSAQLLPDIEDRELLYVAVLIHDIAKGRKEDHSIAGAKEAKKLCPRLGFSKERTELVAWLIQEHLTMSLTAQSRDLSDYKTLENFGEVMQTVERMRYLLILTVCDVRAVGPQVWNGWKGQLLRTLYYETEPLLTGGFSKVDHHQRVERAKQELKDNLQDWDENDLEKIINLHYDPYFLSTPLESQIRHSQFIRQADFSGEKLSTQIHTKDFEAITEINVLAPDHPNLLAMIAGACSAADANIVEAKIHTTRDGRALDSIFINREYENNDDEMRRAERICTVICDGLEGRIHLPEILAKINPTQRKNKAFTVKPDVAIYNDQSNKFTVIQVKCLDRPGVLSAITFAIADLNLNIGSAQIVTFGEKVRDSFYVTDLTGAKITLESRKQKIIQTLTDAILIAIAPKTGKKR